VSVAYGGSWPSVPVPSINSNTRFGAAARRASSSVVSNVAPDWAFLLYWSPRPGAPPGLFYVARPRPVVE
jgi:hypothetical protein